ncbi:MAG: ABC transporter permease [Geminicoccaceae bacterium]|nr:ABC transporter permease [Geminicoccaceae bacterium]MDW8125820.1 ABC transporter permease [Geminicoccaceae bacterium]
MATAAIDLRRALERAERRRALGGFALALPLVAFLFVFFLLPIVGMLAKSVDNHELASVMPKSAELLRTWRGVGPPPEEIVAVFARELKEAYLRREVAVVAQRLNREQAGWRNLILGTARRLPDTAEGGWLATLVRLDPAWGEPAIWAGLRRAAQPWTDIFLLAAVDLARDERDAIRPVPPEQAIYLDILARTFWISALVTLLCLVLGYPLAYLLASLPERWANPLLIVVLLPFWTSLLVRIAAWIVLLQREGVINDFLVRIGVLEEPVALVFNRTGVLVAMTHVLLPFMVLPLYSVMRGIPLSLTRAALSLGATPWVAFRRVYLPLSMPGVAAGSLLVFILALGYYITPALVGGAADQMISYFVAFFTLHTANWGMAAALASLLLVVTLLLYWLYARLVGIERLRLG